MGLSANLKSLVKQAFVATGDLPTLVNFVEVTPGAYDPATDSTTSAETTHTNVPALLVRLTDDEVTWFPADAIMQKALIAYEDLELIPEPHDYLTISGINWQISKIKQVPSNAVHILFIRKS